MALSSTMAVEGGPAALPPLAQYESYRKYLQDYFEAKRASRSGFSYRRFSALMQLSSPNYLQLVIQGKRNLSEELAVRFAKVSKMSAPERRYFISLVRFEHAPSAEVRDDLERQLGQARRQCGGTPLHQAQSHVLVFWWTTLVRELTLLPDFQPSGEWMRGKLAGLVSAEDCERSLYTLLRAGLVARDASGRYRATDNVLDTGDFQLERLRMTRHHQDTLRHWAASLPHVDESLQERGLLNIPIRESKIPELQKRLREFQDELIGWLEKENEPDALVQVGMYLFPYVGALKRQ